MFELSDSHVVQDFIKTVYKLQQDQERVSTNDLSAALDRKAPSVTDMAQRLMKAGLVDYVRYKGVRLTEEGERLALKMLRRHRLIELYLVQELGYSLHEVHDEAENLEHAVSDRFVEAIAARLDHPAYDPHGDPIPSVDGAIQRRQLQPLTDLALDTPARISRFTGQDADMLQHTLDRGLRLDTEIQVIARDPFDGPITIQLPDGEIIIGHSVALTILVEVID